MTSGTSHQSYEFIVVGGGTAGCAIAGKLAQSGHEVLLLEGGRKDNTPFIHMPGAFIRLFSSDRVVSYKSEAQPGAGSRPLFVPQANTLGGGSSVNAMIYIRGTPADYDEWRELGCTGWSWDDLLPLFKRSENNETLSGEYHGIDGPVLVGNAWCGIQANIAFVRAGQEIGLPYNSDFNGERQAGVGFYQSTAYRGRRISSAVAYLVPQRRNPKLKVQTNCKVMRLTTEGSRVTGVIYQSRNGAIDEVRAGREVVVAAGALSTPKILQLSGIGPAALLKEKGIPLVCDAPEVGENYQNHVEVPLHCRLKEPISLLGQDKGLAAIRHGLQYLLFRTGLLASNVSEVGAFIDTLKSGRPDVQLYLIPSLFGSPEWPSPPGHGVSICASLLRPKSRGSVKVKSSDPNDPISFDSGALTHKDDVETLMRAVDVARKVMKAPSFAKIVSGEIFSAAEGERDAQDAESFVRKYTRPISHVVGTCRMGTILGRSLMFNSGSMACLGSVSGMRRSYRS